MAHSNHYTFCRKVLMGEKKLPDQIDLASSDDKTVKATSPAGTSPSAPPDEYLAVPREQVLSQDEAASDLYVRLTSGKMVKVAHKGEKIDKDRIKRLGEKNVRELFVTNTDFSSIVTSLLENAKSKLTKGQNKDSDQATAQYFEIAQSVLTEVTKLPVHVEAVQHATAVTIELSERLEDVTDMSKGLRLILSLGETYSRHAMATVVFANWIARQLGWSSPRVLQPLTLGAFLHDIGLRELPSELQTKSRADFTPEEVALYESHPTRGVMILRQFENIGTDVLQIVGEHHEMPNGQGFPNRLRGDRIFPLARVVSLANLLAHDILDSILVQKNFSKDLLIERLDAVYKSMYGSQMHKAAKSVFKKS